MLGRVLKGYCTFARRVLLLQGKFVGKAEDRGARGLMGNPPVVSYGKLSV
jgi:hypothetical protein